MSKAKWIWYDGEYEIYHNWLVSHRREEFDWMRMTLWQVDRPIEKISFYKEVDVPKNTTFKVISKGEGHVLIGSNRYPLNSDISLKVGAYRIVVEIVDTNTFPTCFIDSEFIKTDESWTAGLYNYMRKPVGYLDCYNSSTDDPAKFEFLYKNIKYKTIENINGGVLYDFGKETFGPVTVSKIHKDDRVQLVYGESKNEALDYENAIIREVLTSKDRRVRPSRAFRYIYVKSEQGNPIEVKAKYEYLPIKDIAHFSCENQLISKIWDVASYTFHLNSREFYLDGIKRDRWVWSGDAYQSFMVNRYLYSDNEIIKRTIVALLGRPPYIAHINTINDYSLYLIIAVWEYYFYSGDKTFVVRIWDRIKELYNFITSRLGENGYVVARAGDWIFIDWGDVEKKSETCAEQILLWEMYNSMSRLSKLVGEADEYINNANNLKSNIFRDFYQEENGWFIDCFKTGTNHVSRQANILAIMYGLVDENICEKIVQNVLFNDNITPIKTPYFKFYELSVLSQLGYIDIMQDYLESYWGAMLDRDATSIWEQFNPEDDEETQYKMYGLKYGKSLCHAWGSGPIYLLMRYCCGVYPTSIGYETFTVKPNFGKYKEINAIVPIGKNKVNILYKNDKLSVKPSCDGGTLIWKGKSYELIKDQEIIV